MTRRRPVITRRRRAAVLLTPEVIDKYLSAAADIVKEVERSLEGVCQVPPSAAGLRLR